MTDFDKTMTESGYMKTQRLEIMTRGLRGYEKLRELDRTGKRPLHRRGKDTINTRFKKKLTGKTSWYKTGQKEDFEWESPWKKKESRRREYQKTRSNGQKPSNPSAILFLPRTNGGTLVTELRKKEESLREMTGNHVKMVERAGISLKSQLFKGDPWGGGPMPHDEL